MFRKLVLVANTKPFWRNFTTYTVHEAFANVCFYDGKKVEPTPSVFKALDFASSFLNQYGITAARLEAQLLLAHALHWTKEELLMAKFHRRLRVEEFSMFRKLLERRATQKPLSYIIGYKEFWKSKFRVSSDTLIPRPSSETLIENILKISKEKSGKWPSNILDLGTGSGCLLLSLLQEFPNAKGVGVDIVEGALGVALYNSRDLGIDHRASWKRSNWFERISKDKKFDIIISNPPYISETEEPTLDKTVREYEPRTALIGGPDGLDCYRLISEGLKQNPGYLSDEGLLFLEIGKGQENKVRTIFNHLKFKESSSDIEGIERCLVFSKV